MSSNPLIKTRPIWREPEPIPKTARWSILDSNPLVSAILYRRGFREPEAAARFMHPGAEPLPHPELIPNVRAAVRRIRLAIERDESIGIFGDYDADGITSTAILASALRAAGSPARVLTRLPQRSEGYGLNLAAIGEFREQGVKLVIATDCASSDHIHAAHVVDEGMDLIIVDHHHMTDTGPEHAITVSPQLAANESLRELTAAGVAYLLVAALAQTGLDVSSTFGTDPRPYLDLAAVGTIADVAPINGVNRSLVALGLDAIHTGARPGLNALIAEAMLERTGITAENIAYSLGPRLNAPGRIDSPDVALELLLAPDMATARPLAVELETLNRERKTRAAQIHAEAWSQFCQHPDWETAAVVAVHSPHWEPGLVGAVASRLVDEVRRPVLLFHQEGSTLHGSARSVEGFNLLAALEASAPMLSRFGGHSLAAGVALELDRLADLNDHLTTIIRTANLPIPTPHELVIDAVLPPEYLTINTPRELARMEPFGRGNEIPTLLIRDAELIKYSTMGGDNRHLKLNIRSQGRSMEAVFWGAAWRSSELVGVRRLHLVGQLSINSWNGNERLQMVLKDFRPQP